MSSFNPGRRSVRKARARLRKAIESIKSGKAREVRVNGKPVALDSLTDELKRLGAVQRSMAHGGRTL